MRSELRRAFSVLEVLVVVTIVLLVAAIVFPVLANARRAGYRAESVSNLRQIGIAIEMYRNDSDGELAFQNLDLVHQLGYLGNRSILMSGGDDFMHGYGWEFSQCYDGDNKMQEHTSYETLMIGEGYYNWVKSIDPEAAIVVDRTHGKKYADYGGACREIELYYSGPILRLYEDTHVGQGNLSIAGRPGATPGAIINFSRLWLFTDLGYDYWKDNSIENKTNNNGINNEGTTAR